MSQYKRTWISQTKYAYDAMKAAGYKKGEFRCWTPCNSRGEYQNAQISVSAKLERQDELLDAVLATGEIAVTRLDYTSTITGIRTHCYIYSTEYKERGKLEIHDVDAAAKWWDEHKSEFEVEE